MKLRRICFVLAAALLACPLLAGCQAANQLTASDVPYPAPVENAILAQAPKKVASLSSNLTEIICELGYGSTLTGRAEETVYPESISQLPTLGSSSDPDIEAIVALKPDLLLSQNSFSKKDMETLTSAGIQVVCIPAASSLEGVQHLYQSLATVFVGKVDGPKKGTAAYQKLADGIAAVTQKIPEQKSFVYAPDLSGLLATPDTFESSVLSLFGENLAQGSGYEADTAAAQKKNPQRFLVAKPYVQNHLASSEAYQGFSAVAENQVVSIDPALFRVQSLRTVDSIRQIAAQLYPDVTFGEVSSSSQGTSSASSGSGSSSGSSATGSSH